MSDLKDKVILVTGSSAGIGEGIAIHLAGLGAKIALTGRGEKNLERVAGRCKSAGSDESKILCVTGDIRSQAVRESMISKTVERFGQLDVLINNAGLIHACDSTAATEERYDEVFDVNVKSVVFLTKLAVPHLRKSKGNIINISSVAGTAPVAGYISYCMSKAALEMFSNCLSLACIKRGPCEYYKFLNECVKKIPIGRYGQPVEIARAVAFLASNEQALLITGNAMFIDGAHRFRFQ